MRKTFMSFSFGCRVNEAEKQKLDRELFHAGIIWDEQTPDFYIINSCAITGKAEREVRQHIYQIRKKYPNTKIIVTGCAATLWMKNKMTMDEVDYWIDNREKITIPSIVQKFSDPSSTTKQLSTYDKFLKSGKVIIKIQDGCNRFCSYCIVPHTRGRASSKTITEIINEISAITVDVKELILTGINTEYFGIDTGEKLTDLLDAIFNQTTVPRVSFGSIHPWSITDEFIAWYKQNKVNPRFVHFFHIPIQSGSDTVLHLMNRPYNIATVSAQLDKLHAIDPHALIATDIIVGFPGEGKKEFEETYTFLQKSPITKFHVFRYSERPGTKSATLPNQVSPADKHERSQRLINLGKEKINRHA